VHDRLPGEGCVQRQVTSLNFQKLNDNISVAVQERGICDP